MSEWQKPSSSAGETPEGDDASRLLADVSQQQSTSFLHPLLSTLTTTVPPTTVPTNPLLSLPPSTSYASESAAYNSTLMAFAAATVNATTNVPTNIPRNVAETAQQYAALLQEYQQRQVSLANLLSQPSLPAVTTAAETQPETSSLHILALAATQHRQRLIANGTLAASSPAMNLTLQPTTTHQALSLPPATVTAEQAMAFAQLVNHRQEAAQASQLSLSSGHNVTVDRSLSQAIELAQAQLKAQQKRQEEEQRQQQLQQLLKKAFRELNPMEPLPKTLPPVSLNTRTAAEIRAQRCSESHMELQHLMNAENRPTTSAVMRPSHTTTGGRSNRLKSSAVNRVPTSADSLSTIVSYLFTFNVSPEPEFSRKAIESLIKKLKDRHEELELLINVVTTAGDSLPDVGGCVTIPRTLDGRLQVAGRKGFPHQVYGRIWRWPEVHKNEIKHLAGVCVNAFEMKTDSVCVNPYHYYKTESHGDILHHTGQVIPFGSPIRGKRSMGDYASPSVPPDPAPAGHSCARDDDKPPPAKTMRTDSRCMVPTPPHVLLQRFQNRAVCPIGVARVSAFSVPKPFNGGDEQPEEQIEAQPKPDAKDTGAEKNKPAKSVSPVVVEQKPKETDPYRVLRERLSMDLLRNPRFAADEAIAHKRDGEIKENMERAESIESSKLSLSEFCELFPLSAAAFMEFLSSLCVQQSEEMKEKCPDMGGFVLPFRRALMAGRPVALPVAEKMVLEVSGFFVDLVARLRHHRVGLVTPLTRLLKTAEKAPQDALSEMIQCVNPKLLFAPPSIHSTPDKKIFNWESLEEHRNSSLFYSIKHFEFGNQKGTPITLNDCYGVLGAKAHPLLSSACAKTVVNLQNNISDGSELQSRIEKDALSKVRRLMNGGIFVETDLYGDVYFRLMSRHCIIINSEYLTRVAGPNQTENGCVMLPGDRVKVFDLQYAFNNMCFWIIHNSAAEGNGLGFMDPEAFSKQMRKFAVVQCSFSYGWNSKEFPSFRSAPCALEFYITQALNGLWRFMRSAKEARFYLRYGKFLHTEEEQQLLPGPSAAVIVGGDVLQNKPSTSKVVPRKHLHVEHYDNAEMVEPLKHKLAKPIQNPLDESRTEAESAN